MTRNEGIYCRFKSTICSRFFQKIICFKKVFLTKTLPGVYVIYFPHNNTVYVGQSVNVSREVTVLRNGYRKKPAVNEAFKWNNEKAVAFSVVQGSGWTEKKKKARVNIERIIIILAGYSSINVIGNIKPKVNPFLKDPAIKRAVFTPFTESWN